MVQGPGQDKAAWYDRLRDEGKTHEQAIAEIERGSVASDSLPSAAPVDRVDQTTVRNPEGQDPLVRYGIPAAKLYATLAGGVAGGGAGYTLGKVLAGKAGAGVLGRMGIGALAGMTGGLGARAVGSALEGKNPTEGLLNPKSLAIDAAVGGALPAVGAAVGQVKKLAGFSPTVTKAKAVQSSVEEATRRMGQTPAQVEGAIVGASRNPLEGQAVMDLHPQLQGLGANAARHSATAERELQEFVGARADAPLRGIVKDVETALGTQATDVPLTAKKMREAIRFNDKLRFPPLWKQYPQAIVEPKTVRQVSAILDNVEGARARLIKGQKISLKPVKEMLQKVEIGGKQREVVTLRGLHRIKTMLDKGIQAGAKAEAAGTITSDAATALHDLRTAKKQLLELDLNGVPGGKEYKAALKAAAQEHSLIDAMKSGAKTTASKVSPGFAGEMLQEASAVPGGAESFRKGLAGQIAQRANETGSLNPFFNNRNLSGKIAAAATSPEAAAAREARLPGWRAMDITNRIQGDIKPPSYTLSGQPGPVGDIAGNIGASQAAGQLATGNIPAAKGGLTLWLGNTLFRGAVARNRKAQEKAWEEIAPWLKMQPGQEAADLYRKLLTAFNTIRRGKTVSSAVLSGGSAGALSGLRGRDRQ